MLCTLGMDLFITHCCEKHGREGELPRPCLESEFEPGRSSGTAGSAWLSKTRSISIISGFHLLAPVGKSYVRGLDLFDATIINPSTRFLLLSNRCPDFNLRLQYITWLFRPSKLPLRRPQTRSRPIHRIYPSSRTLVRSSRVLRATLSTYFFRVM